MPFYLKYLQFILSCWLFSAVCELFVVMTVNVFSSRKKAMKLQIVCLFHLHFSQWIIRLQWKHTKKSIKNINRSNPSFAKSIDCTNIKLLVDAKYKLNNTHSNINIRYKTELFNVWQRCARCACSSGCRRCLRQLQGRQIDFLGRLSKHNDISNEAMLTPFEILQICRFRISIFLCIVDIKDHLVEIFLEKMQGGRYWITLFICDFLEIYKCFGKSIYCIS